MKIYVNGTLVEKQNAKISVFDHGFLYGDGVFEGIRSYNCRVFRLKEHIDRLYESAHSIMLSINMSKEKMIDAVLQTLKANNVPDAYIRLIVSRGEGDLGLDPRKCVGRETIIIITDSITLYPAKLYREGMAIITVPTTRNVAEAVNPQIKSLNYLNNILAKIEAVNAGYQEAIMLNHLGFVAECTGDNIFIIKNNELLTPPAYMGSLRGITREAVLEIAQKLGIPAREAVFTRHEIFNAHECFLTGTAAELIPVVKLDGRSIGTGTPGKTTLRISRAFSALTKKDGIAYRLRSGA